MEIFSTQFQTMLCIVLNFLVIENLLAFQYVFLKKKKNCREGIRKASIHVQTGTNGKSCMKNAHSPS